MSASAFERAFEREHALAMRDARSFALVVFIPVVPDVEQLCQLARLVKARVRVSDLLGRLDSQRLGLLLPETDGQGAWKVADDLSAQIARAELSFDIEVHSPRGKDPESPTNGGNGSGNGTHQATKAAKERVICRHADEGHASALRAIRDRKRAVEDLTPIRCQPLSFRKRAFDLVGASILLVVLTPLLSIVALAIKLTSPGPVFFKQIRVGLGGRQFLFYKFRTMSVDAEARKQSLRPRNEIDGPIFKMKADPRVTPLGRILRRTSIDELPQLWNVIRGEMSLVGPRPPTPDEVEQYEPWQRQRLDLTGGLTCIWQVSGRSLIGFSDWVRMDIRYARQRGPRMDLRLLARTVGAVLSRRGAF